jgi:hypothetical protein
MAPLVDENHDAQDDGDGDEINQEIMHKASESILILSAPRYELDFKTREAAGFGVSL